MGISTINVAIAVTWKMSWEVSNRARGKAVEDHVLDVMGMPKALMITEQSVEFSGLEILFLRHLVQFLAKCDIMVNFGVYFFIVTSSRI